MPVSSSVGTIRVSWLLAVAWVTAGWATPPSNLEMSEITGPCASIAAPETSAIQASLTGFFARNDSLAVSTRSTRLLASTSDVLPVLVADTMVCKRVRRAVDSLSGLWHHPTLQQPDSNRAIWLFYADSMLVALDLDAARPENRSDWMVFRPSGIRVGQWR